MLFVLKKYIEFFKFIEVKIFLNRIISIYDIFFKNCICWCFKGKNWVNVWFISLSWLIKEIIREEIGDLFKLFRWEIIIIKIWVMVLV